MNPMNDDRGPEHSRRFEVRVTAESHFAWLRTRLAVERTMMAYMRTSVSLIGFGFGIFQIIFKFQRSPEIASVQFPDAAWYLGLALIFGGVVAAVFSAVEYRWTLRYLWGGGFEAVAGMTGKGKNTPLYAVTLVIILVGVFAFFAVLLRLL
jgi:putative membrane protein